MVAPAFLIMIAVSAEFARLSMIRNLSQNAAYEAARFVMTEGAKVADGIERANDILGRLGAVDADITINGSDGSTNEDGDVENEIAFDTPAITCRIEIELKDNSYIFPESFFGDTKIVSSMTIRTERYRGYYDASTAPN
jgi:hypothetical protein